MQLKENGHKMRDTHLARIVAAPRLRKEALEADLNLAVEALVGLLVQPNAWTHSCHILRHGHLEERKMGTSHVIGQ